MVISNANKIVRRKYEDGEVVIGERGSQGFHRRAAQLKNTLIPNRHFGFVQEVLLYRICDV